MIAEDAEFSDGTIAVVRVRTNDATEDAPAEVTEDAPAEGANDGVLTYVEEAVNVTINGVGHTIAAGEVWLDEHVVSMLESIGKKVTRL